MKPSDDRRRKARRRATARHGHRLLRAIAWLIVAYLLFAIVGGYAPYIRLPELSDDNSAAVEARADAMQRDIQTADRATILESRAEALDERVRLIRQAQQEIIIASYDCRDSESTRDILCAALERADAGVRVRILLDGLTAELNVSDRPLFRALNAHANIEIRFYNPPDPLRPWRLMSRMHDKYVIVDDVAYILGGRNMFDHFLGAYPSPTGTYSNDREALVYNGAHGTPDDAESSLYQVRAYFENIWAQGDTAAFSGRSLDESRRDRVYAELRERLAALERQRPELFEPPDYPAVTLPTRGVWLISNPTNVGVKQPVVFAQLCALIFRAEDDVVIHSPYAVLNPAMRARLSDIAARIPVTLMINAVENGANFAASSDYLYHRGEIIATGVRVLEHAGGDSYHGKSVAIDDDLSIIGSFNLDLRSTYIDTELMLVIRGEAVNRLLRGHMEALHDASRRVVDAQTAVVPDGLDIPTLPAWKGALLRVLGALLQPFRNVI